MKRRLSTSTAQAAGAASRRERRSLELRERLFRAALHLFAEKGYAETTVEDITNRADTGKGTFFNYFPSKDHILLAFGDMQLNKLQELVAQAKAIRTPMPEFLRELTLKMTAEPQRNPTMMRTLLQANLSSPAVREGMMRNHQRGQQLLTELIRLGQQRGEIASDLDAGEVALVFRQAVFGTLLIWSAFGDGSLVSRVDAVFRLLWSGIAPRNLEAAAR
jgi:AcrR family transcriptional regulator